MPKGLGHREQGFRMLGSESLGVLESEIHESGIQARRNQRFGWSQGFRATWSQGCACKTACWPCWNHPFQGNLQVPWLPDKGLSVGAHSWLQGNLQGLWLPGIPGGCDLGRAQHCQARRNAARQGETLAGGVHNAGGARHPFSNCWFRLARGSLARGSLARACLTLEPLSHWGPVSHWGQSCMEGAVCFLW